MSRRVSLSPDIVPVLSTGRHRSPRKGACFMEMASYLAGERWSDHPKCTHPLLAGLARQVNDTVPDSVRTRLAPMIPSVIGLTSEDVRVDAAIALHCARTALPIASATRQNVLALGILACERVLAELDGRSRDALTPASRAALDQVPSAEQWAREFRADLPLTTRAFRRQTAPHLVALAVEGISEACAEDPFGRLVDLLEDCIALTSDLVGEPAAPAVVPGPWATPVTARTPAAARTPADSAAEG
jgi:hypothetical protein